jgi:hypothetical protein
MECLLVSAAGSVGIVDQNRVAAGLVRPCTRVETCERWRFWGSAPRFQESRGVEMSRGQRLPQSGTTDDAALTHALSASLLRAAASSQANSVSPSGVSSSLRASRQPMLRNSQICRSSERQGSGRRMLGTSTEGPLATAAFEPGLQADARSADQRQSRKAAPPGVHRPSQAMRRCGARRRGRVDPP